MKSFIQGTDFYIWLLRDYRGEALSSALVYGKQRKVV